MADNSSTYRPAPGNRIAEDDPFAELTRIMGFDPREKVQPRREEPEPDFGIDLERELLGSLEAEQPAEEPRAEFVAAAPRPTAGPTYEAAFAIDESYDETWRYQPDVTEPAVEASAEAQAEPVSDIEPAQMDAAQQVPAEEDLADPVGDELAASFDAALHEGLAGEAAEAADQDTVSAAGMIEVTGEPAGADLVEDPVFIDDFAGEIGEALEAQPEPEAEAALDPAFSAGEESPHDSAPEASLVDEQPAQPVDERADELAVQPAGGTENFELQLADMMAAPEVAEQVSCEQVEPEQPADDGAWYSELEFAEPDAQSETFTAHDWRDQPVQWAAEPAGEAAAPFADAHEDASEATEPAKPVAEASSGKRSLLAGWHSGPKAEAQQDLAPALEAVPSDEIPALSSDEPFSDFENAEQVSAGIQPEAEWEPAVLVTTEPAAVEVPEAQDWPEAPVEDGIAVAATPHLDEPEASDAWQDAGEHPQPETPETETDAMQPFDERAFDAALADELAADPSQPDQDWSGNQWQGDSRYTPAAETQGGHHYAARATVASPSIQMEAPEIETVDFVEARVAPSDELDLPEVQYGDERTPNRGFDDFDAEFASAFNALNEEQPSARAGTPMNASAPQATAYDHPAYGPEHEFDYATDAALGSGLAGASAAQASSLSRAGLYEPQEYEEEAGVPVTAYGRAKTRPNRRGMLLGGAVAAVALLAGAGVYAMWGGSAADAPTVLRADSDPIKVRPENPGGTTVPNQDNVVYDRVGSGQPLGAPTQERLITTAEAPVELAKPPVEDLAAFSPGAEKSEERLEPAQADGSAPLAEEMVAVAPRKVRTMIVRPDGTMVPREEPAAPQAEPTEVAAAQPSTPTAEPVANQPAVSPEPAAQAPSIDARPAEPAPEVAAVQPAPETAAPAPIEAAAAPSGWSVQIASQPSAASAQASYEDLSRRYSSVLGGKGVNIVKADIAGKGTYYRVRIPAASRADANSLCASYKSAGGSCFVSQ